MHDKNGTELRVGDVVTVEFVVGDLYPGADTCNIRLIRRQEDEQKLDLTCQAKQTLLVSRPPALADDSADASASSSAASAPPASAPAPESSDAAPATPAPADAPPATDAASDVVDVTTSESPQRCDCSALDGPHVHLAGGPEPLASDDAEQ